MASGGGGTNFAFVEHPLQMIVESFDAIVAALVVLVDGAFDLRDLLVGNVRTARDILFVPKEEVEFVLFANGIEKIAVVVFHRLKMPKLNGRIVQRSDEADVDHDYQL
jgi:hypothetical protein